MSYLSIALADTILARFPGPDTIPYRRWCYVHGYVLCAFEQLWRYSGDSILASGRGIRALPAAHPCAA